MQGERDGQTISPPPSMLTDETIKNDISSTSASSSHNSSTELAYLPIGCSVSAKYRGAFCSAQVKAIEKQVKLKVTLLDSGDTITISEEQLVHTVPLRIGNGVTVRLASSNRRQSNDSNSNHHYSRSGLAAFINPTNPDEKQATIKQIIDNSIYTVVFNDGDERSLRRSSLCLQGVRLYQTQYGQQKILEEMPTSPPQPPPPPSSSSTTTAPADTTSTNANDIASIVAIKRHGSSDQQAFPALILKRKALADYMWVRSFLDGREYIVNTRDDVHSYNNNSDIQALCRTTSKQAVQACDKYIKYNQIPAVWHKKKNKQTKSDDKNAESDEESSSESDSNSSESEDDEEETTEEKDSFVAQLFAFMDDRGTPINNIPKVQNYDLDLHRLFKIVRMLGGYNKVTKNDQWSKVHIKMGLPDEVSSENGRSIEHAYKKYLFAYEDLSKKLGSMNAPSAYFGGRTSLGSDSRRSLIRVRQQQQQQQEEEKNQKKAAKAKKSPASIKQRSRKSNESRPSTDSKPAPPSATKKPPTKIPTPSNRKAPNRMKTANILSSSTSDSESESESETSDDDSSRSSSSHYTKTKAKAPPPTATQKKPVATSSGIPKKVNQSTSASSATITSSKTDVKKVSTSTKPSSAHDTKPSKLTITIPISKSKNQTNNSAAGNQGIKKPNVNAPHKDEKKKPSDVKSVQIKTEPKTVPLLTTKKTIVSSSKTSQITKTNQQQKHSSNEPVKSSTATKPPPSSLLPFKPKTTQSQTSTNNNNNKERSGLTKPTSTSNESRQIKPPKINSSSLKTSSQERSASAPVKKTKPIIHEDAIIKPISSASTMKIPKLSANNHESTKKPTASMDKIPKKQVPKETNNKTSKTQENTPTSNKSTVEQHIKSHTPSPTRTPVSDPIKKTLTREISASPITPVTPSSPPHLSSISSINDEPLLIPNLSVSSSNLQSVNSSTDTTSEFKVLESSVVTPTISVIATEPEVTSNKRPHADDNSEPVCVSSSIGEIDEQLSPLKRARRSISSQESIETFSSTDPPSANDYVSANRNTQLTYEDISMNDVLLVTWGTQGIKQYPARCIEKNDDKKELLVHYTGWNSRHDEWIKLDRVIERKDANNATTLFQHRPRRTSQISTVRQHLDSTCSTISNEPLNPPQIPSSSNVDINSSSTNIDDDEQNKVTKTVSIEKAKIEESDIDDNSQGQSEIWNHVETISSTEDDALSYSSTIRTSQSDSNKLLNEETTTNIRRSISTPNNENILSNINEFEPMEENDTETEPLRDDERSLTSIPKRRQSRVASSTNKVQADATLSVKTEQNEELPRSAALSVEHSHQYPYHVKEETIDSSTVNQQQFQTPLLPPPLIPSSATIELIQPLTNILTSSPASATSNRRSSVRQQKRRSLREPSFPKDSSLMTKKRAKFDNANVINTDIGIDNLNNMDQISTRSNSTEQQSTESITTKRSRPPGRRGGKRSANQQEYENEDYRSSSPSNITMRQQLKEMFKHRPSRYNFLDLNNTLTGDERINHLKDRMRECQKVFFNLKSALVKIEKQRKIFLRKQKPIINTPATIIQTATTEIIATPTCT